MPEPVTVTLSALAATVTVVKALGDLVAPPVAETLSGHSHTQQGAKLMDDTIDILTDETKYASMLPASREQHIKNHQTLVPVRQELEESTKTRIGSIVNASKARKFRARAEKLYQNTKTDSDSARSADALDSLGKAKRPKPDPSAAQSGDASAHTDTELRSSESCSEETPQALGRSTKLIQTEEASREAPPQEFELKIVGGHNQVKANRVDVQGQSETSEAGSSSAAEACLRAIKSPGGWDANNHPLA